MNKKNIVIVNQDSGYLMIDLAHMYLEQGFDVSLVTGRIVEREIKLNPKVKVFKILKYNRQSAFKRIFTWLFATVQILNLILFKLKWRNFLIVSNPPFSYFLTRFIKGKYSLLIYDIYPDILVESKMIGKSSFLNKIWVKSNVRSFKGAKNIFTLNEEMKVVLEKYVSGSKIKVIPIWTNNSFLKPIDKSDNPFVAQYNLTEKFVIMYSGNLGKTHDINVIFNALEELGEEFVFVIVGGGEKFDQIKREVDNKKLKKVMAIPWLPPEMIQFSLNAADVGVVSLASKSSTLSIPSKTYNLMSVGIPILGLSGSNSALGELIETLNIGSNFNHQDKNGIVNFLLKLNKDRNFYQRYCYNSLEASKMFGPENALNFFSD